MAIDYEDELWCKLSYEESSDPSAADTEERNKEETEMRRRDKRKFIYLIKREKYLICQLIFILTILFSP